MFLLKKIWKGVPSIVSLILILTCPETSFLSLFSPTNSWKKSAKVHSNLIRAILFFTIVSFWFTIVTHTAASMFHITFNEFNENLKAHVPSNSIYQHRININNWAGVHSMFHITFNEFNENLKAHVPSNSIYQHRININNWAGVQWDIDVHVGT